MEPNAIYATRQGNLDGEKIEMSVDAASMAHVMSILTDLYSDPTMAVIREYSTNARDAMIEAGNGDQPIEVSLPNAMSPFFKVRDYGVGLSVEDIRNIYSKYGASTKRSTNEQVGMLGLGCKSALTYTQQFTVRSVKDAQLVLVAISRTEDGSGVMEVVHTSDTDEKNGVEISVPVNRSNDFSWKANDFFRFWEPGTVLVDGQTPKSFKDEAMQISDNLYITKNQPTDYVVMGNVAYRVNSENPLYKTSYGYYGSRNFGVIAIVPIGSVNFTPSREDLHYTKHTLATIENVREEANKNLAAAVQREIDSQQTCRDARIVAERWGNVARFATNPTFNGQTIPTTVNVEHLRYRMNYGRGSVEFFNGMNFSQAEKFIFVDGYEKQEISTAHRAKFRLWAEKNGHHGASTFVVTKDKVDTTWFNPLVCVSWDEVFKCRPERKKSDSKDIVYSIRSSDEYRYDRNVTELPKAKNIVVWSRGDNEILDAIQQIARISEDTVFVNLPKNRWDKFIRENSGAMTIKVYMQKLMDDSFKGLSSDDITCMTMNYDERATFKMLDESKVVDPELARKIRSAKISLSDAANRYSDIANVCRRISVSVPALEKSENMLDRYPLMRAVNGLDLQIRHCYDYISAIYNSNK